MEEVCKDLEYEIKLMAGASKEWATFIIVDQMEKPLRTLVLHGSCSCSEVILGIGMSSRREFDLHDPDSILKIKEFIKSDLPWRIASR